MMMKGEGVYDVDWKANYNAIFILVDVKNHKLNFSSTKEKNCGISLFISLGKFMV